MRAISFSTYRIDAPRYGGPIRVNAHHRILKQRGWEMRHVCVVNDGAPEPPPGDQVVFGLSHEYAHALKKRGGRPDVDAAGFILGDRKRLGRFVEAIESFAPDVVILEQPWVWPAVKAWLALARTADVVIIYASHNVEEQLIEPLVAESAPDIRARIVAQVRDIERDLVQSCDGVVAVSDADAAYFRTFGKPVLVAANGVWPRSQPGGLEYWRREFAWISYMLFVGSAHPPNANGFMEMLGPALSYMAPDERIVVVGGVDGLIDRHPDARRFRGLNAARMRSVGVQDDEGLSTMLEFCKGILLPITQGGGTNLKTAEALYNRVPIVGTTIAFRGYESFMSFPGITVCDDAPAFRAAMLNVLKAPKTTLHHSNDQDLALEQLLWSSTLATIPNFMVTAVRAKRTSAASATVKALAFRHVSLGDNLGFGWHGVEDGGVWTAEHVACFDLSGRGSQAADAVVEFAVSEPPVAGKASLSVFTRAGLQFRWRFDGTPTRINIPVHLSTADQSDRQVSEVFFQVDRLHSPSKLSGGPDTRNLGVYLRHVALYAAVVINADRAEYGDGGIVYRCASSAECDARWLVLDLASDQLKDIFRVAVEIPDLDDTAAFVTAAYAVLLRRPIDPPAMANALTAVGPDAASRSSLLRLLLHSEEGRRIGRRLLVEFDEDSLEKPIGHALFDLGGDYAVVVERSEGRFEPHSPARGRTV